jgi:hypothetical protein
MLVAIIADVWHADVHLDSPRRSHCSHRITGTVEILLKGDPSTTRVLYARYTSVRCARSTMRTTWVSLKMSEVFTLFTTRHFTESFEMSIQAVAPSYTLSGERSIQQEQTMSDHLRRYRAIRDA